MNSNRTWYLLELSWKQVPAALFYYYILTTNKLQNCARGAVAFPTHVYDERRTFSMSHVWISFYLLTSLPPFFIKKIDDDDDVNV